MDIIHMRLRDPHMGCSFHVESIRGISMTFAMYDPDGTPCLTVYCSYYNTFVCNFWNVFQFLEVLFSWTMFGKILVEFFLKITAIFLEKFCPKYPAISQLTTHSGGRYWVKVDGADACYQTFCHFCEFLGAPNEKSFSLLKQMQITSFSNCFEQPSLAWWFAAVRFCRIFVSSVDQVSESEFLHW